MLRPLLATLLLVTCLSASAVQAQPRGSYDRGIGIQLGDPSGLAGKYYPRTGVAYDALLAFDLGDDSFFLSIHRLTEQPLSTGDVDAPLNFYYGIGGLIGADNDDDGSETLLGISFLGGVNFFIGRYEVFLQAAPGLQVIPSTEGFINVGGGLRYYF